MSTKHCIDKLLEKPYKPQTPYNKVINIPDSPTSRRDYHLKEESSGYRRSVLHVPREYTPRPIKNCPYGPMHSPYHSRVIQCSCPTCMEHIPPWLKEPRPPRYLTAEKSAGYHTYMRYPYLAHDEHDQTALVGSSLATRAKQQPCPNSTGGSKRKKRHRTAFTPTQLLGLENAFDQNHYSVGDERKHLASFLGLSETQIKVWFQNRRTKWKRLRREADEATSGEDDHESEAESMKYEIESENTQYEVKYRQYEAYEQHHGSYSDFNEQYECGKLWPTRHFCSGKSRYQY